MNQFGLAFAIKNMHNLTNKTQLCTIMATGIFPDGIAHVERAAPAFSPGREIFSNQAVKTSADHLFLAHLR